MKLNFFLLNAFSSSRVVLVDMVKVFLLELHLNRRLGLKFSCFG